MFAALLERLTDWRRERRIGALREQIRAAYEAGDKTGVTRHAHAMFAECDARSEAQKQRMERRILERMDPHARAVFERSKGA